MPFVATSVDQLRVGDEVEANHEDGSLERGVIHRIEATHGRNAMVHFGGSQYRDSLGWYFDPSPHFGFTRTWNVLSRDLEPEAVTPRPRQGTPLEPGPPDVAAIGAPACVPTSTRTIAR